MRRQFFVIIDSLLNKLRQKKYVPGGIRETMAISLPMIVSHALDTLMTMVDRLFLARLGTLHMSASMAGGLASFTSTTFFMGLIGYANALVAQSLGARREKSCSRILIQALIIALMSRSVVVSLTRPFARIIFGASSIDPQQLVLQNQYFNILILGSIVPLIRHALASFFSGIGETRVIMVASVVGLLVNAGANYGLIFGNFGLPAWGIQGAAVGTILGGIATVAVMAGQYAKRRVRHRFGGTKRSLRYHRIYFWTLVRKGSPAGLEMFLNLFSFQLLVQLFHGQGAVVAAAATIMFTWDSISYVPLLGIEVAMSSLVGRYAAAKKFDIVKKATRSGIFIGWGFSAVVLVAFVGFPEFLVHVFRPHPVDDMFLQAFPISVFMLRIAALYVFTQAVMVVFAGALRGAGDTFWTMVIMVSVNWALVGILYILLNVLDLGAKVGWAATVAVFVVFPVFLIARWRTGNWKTILD